MTVTLQAQLNSLFCYLTSHYPAIASAIHHTAIVLHCGCQG